MSVESKVAAAMAKSLAAVKPLTPDVKKISAIHATYRKRTPYYTKNQAMRASLKVLADEGAIEEVDPNMDKKEAPKTEEKKPDANPDRLKVLVDSDAARLVQKLYNQYVSEDDYADLVIFIKDFDGLLAKYRKDKPLTKEEIARIEREQGGADEDGPMSKPKKKKRAESQDDIENPMPETEDDMDEDEVRPEVEGYDPANENSEQEDDEDEEEEPSIVISKANSIAASLSFHINNAKPNVAPAKNKVVANVGATILQQLGGNKFIAMTGSKNFVKDKNSLQFDIPARMAKNGINKFKITLATDDTYTLTAMKYRNLEVKTVDEKTGIYVDKLTATFKAMTGLDTSL